MTKTMTNTAGSFPACAQCRAAGFCARPAGSTDAYRITARRLRHGEPFHSADVPAHTFFVLCEGTAKLCRRGAGEHAQVTGFHIPGELISFEAMADPSARQDAVALESCTIREITCHCDPQPNSAIWSAMLGLLRADAAQRRARLRPFAGRQTASQRLMAWLGNIADRYQQRGLDPRVVALRMTRAEIGSYLGLAKETVCRLFVQFQRHGWIEQRGRRFLIRRPEAFHG
jgi:CRP/FNR family transcriptional regulator